ncbi:pre-rRNA-processing protein TSR2 homolog isoform X2 [Ambystoma mexicanum]|uniref:pre-rRNA-processing protein TSR2 homolog isoform X2 n=1 Tax=Ambystoma mexicanum TaxID=8296 RepID=UPI0037E717C1
MGVQEAWRIAVDNGFGGAYSQEKAEWMVGALEEYFQINADLEQHEVEDFLSELMNNEFDTLVEDGSLPEVAQHVCTFYRQWQRGEVDAMQQRITELCQKKQNVKVSAVQGRVPDQDNDDSEEEEQEAMDCEVAPPAVPPPEAATRPAEPDDQAAANGWTVVRKKKK